MNKEQLQLLSDFLHKLNNLAATESGYVQILLSKTKNFDENDRKYLDILAKTSVSMSPVIKDINFLLRKEFARMEENEIWKR